MASEFFKHSSKMGKDRYLKISDSVFLKSATLKYKSGTIEFTLAKAFDTIGTEYRVRLYTKSGIDNISTESFCIVIGGISAVFVDSRNYTVEVPETVISFLEVALASKNGDVVTVDYITDHAFISLTATNVECVNE